MKIKVIAILAAMKIIIIALWLFTSLNPFSGAPVSAKVPPDGPGPAASEAHESGATSSGDGKALMEAIARKEEELKAREEELKEKRRELAGVRGDIEARLKRLKALLKEFQAVKQKIDTFNNEKARRLVKIYESMAPQDAALRIERLDDKMAASILGSMREKIAGKILGFVNVDKSVKISRVLKKEIR